MIWNVYLSKQEGSVRVDNYLNGVMIIRKSDYWGTSGKLLQKAAEQIKFNNEKNIAATYLTTYDAFTDDSFAECLRNDIKSKDEIGVWFEVTKILADKAGVTWYGKLGLEWVHTTSVQMLPGYTNEEKEKLIDEIMRSFKEVFGRYPKTIGAWCLDIYSLNYIAKNYGADAAVICREQWGMDAISLWGGPYYGGYYPCKNNIMCPAQTESEQIDIPIFRMYVNDPIYCYYEHKDEKYNGVPPGPITQEPGYDKKTGQNPAWLKWIWECLFGEKSVGFAYFQLGQENSFGWENVKNGMSIQYELLKKYANDKYGLEYITVGEMGKRFKEQYKTTPIRTVAALDDWRNSGRQSLWFNNSGYRINFFADKENVWIRDIHIFDESYKERYLTEPCETHGILYDNLPAVDGIRFAATETEKPGLYFGKGIIDSCCCKDDICTVTVRTDDNLIEIKLCGRKIEFSASKDFELDFKYNCAPYSSRDFIIKVSEKEIKYALRRKLYSVVTEEGRIENMTLKSENKKLSIVLKTNQ